MTPSIDIHTHMLNRDWLELLRQHGKPRFELRKSLDAPEGIMMDGAPFMTPMPGHFDYDYRIKRMDEAKVDLAIVSLTCPNVYFGGAEVSLRVQGSRWLDSVGDHLTPADAELAVKAIHSWRQASAESDEPTQQVPDCEVLDCG